MQSPNHTFHGHQPFLAIVLVEGALVLGACSHQSSGPAATSEPAPAVASARTSSTPSDVQLFFDTGSTNLSAASNQKLDEAARLYREGHPVVMFVAGHADSTGSEYPNLLLSAARAQAAKEGLVARGIPSDRLQLQAMGTSLPRDPNEAMPQDNRRVVITWR